MNTVDWSPKGTGTVWNKTGTNGLEVARNDGGVAPWGVWRLHAGGSRYAGSYGSYSDCLVIFFARAAELDFYENRSYDAVYSGDLVEP